MTDYQTLKVEREESGLHWLRFARPDALNALNTTMVAELHRFLDTLESDEGARVVIVRAEGKAFCAGLDLKEERERDGGVSAALRVQREMSRLVVRMHRAPQPFIACIHGAACGGGFALALASDVRIAADTAKMNAAFVRIGLSGCDMGTSYFLPRLVGQSLAAELLLTGDFIEASRALDSGLVSRVVAESELDRTARSLAESMLKSTPLALGLTKECLGHNAFTDSLEQAIAMEDRNQILASQDADFFEAVKAFMERRPPRFGRGQ